MEGWHCKTASAGGREQGAGEAVVYTAFHLSVSIQFTFCECYESTQRNTTWWNNHACKTCVYLETARTSSVCRVPIQEIKAGWFMAFYCTSWPLLMFSSLRNGRSCNLDFYCAVCQPSPHPRSLFLFPFLGELALSLGDESLWRQMSVKGTESKHRANEHVARFYLPSLKIQYPEKEKWL